MKRLSQLLILIFLSLSLEAQVKFVSRFEVESDYFDHRFETFKTSNGLVSFRVISSQKGLSIKRVFQYFISDFNLNTDGMTELPVKEGYDMLGYDLDADFLYVLFQKGYSHNAEKYILQISLNTRQSVEYSVSNVLEMELSEFLVQEKRVIFMGSSDDRPVIQVFNLDDNRIHTVQGIYGNDSQVLQIQKMVEIQAFEVVLSRKGHYRNVEISINTYDLDGNLLREIKVDEFGQPGQEIMDALLLSKKNYEQLMVGAFGFERRGSYQGMYLMDINEFGEYESKLYTLTDFPNFFNYLNEKAKEKKDREILKEIDRNKIPSIKDAYMLRAATQVQDSYYFYFDHYNIVNSRGNYRSPFTPTGIYRYDRWNRMGYGLLNTDPYFSNRYPLTRTYRTETEYNYISAHFVKIGPEGQVIWDNSATYNDFNTTYPRGFGEIAVVGDEFYHAYVRDQSIVLSYFKNGEKVFDDLDFEIKLVNENERIAESNTESLRLVHWYDQWFLLSGFQRIRYQDEFGAGKSREVFFVSKVLVAGDLYESEDSSK